jgi:general nucleoside transport system permease protein
VPNSEIIGLVVGSAVASGTPVLFATTGEILAQRSGIVNLGVEGCMLLGAVTSAWVYTMTSNLPLAVLASAVVGASIGMLHVTLVVLASTGMLASGICVFFIGRGLSAFFGNTLVGVPLPGLQRLQIPVLGSLPFVGDALFSQDGLVYLSLLIVVATWYVLFRTRLGLMLRATGENTEIARAQGLPTTAIQLAACSAGAALAGIGGAHIVLGFSHTWMEGVTGGRGWVAIGMVILARWNPLYAVPLAYLFGGVIAIQLNAQAAGIKTSPYLLAMLPYVLTIMALIGARIWKQSSGPPAQIARAGQP